MDELTVLYSWIFMAVFLLVMIYIGWLGMKKTATSDDFATARSSYNPWVLSLAITATMASGATFMGMPGLSFQIGTPSLWYPLLYPVASVFGMLLVARYIKKFGDSFGTRTIPEFMGERYNSEFLRLLLAAVSIFLIFYVVGQFVAAATMFQTILGLDYNFALFLTAAVLAAYVFMGGSHSDIMTDAIQGALMLVIALIVLFVFVSGAGIDGGFQGMVNLIEQRRPEGAFDTFLVPGHAVYGSGWLIAAIIVAHIPFGILPHIGNKFMAVKTQKDLKTLLMLCTIIAPLMGVMGLGGMLGIAVLDPAQEIRPDQVIPMLFGELFPPIIAAFFAVAVLSAILSTSDGLVVSLTQIFANDIYRKAIVPRFNIPADKAERTEMRISRWGTFVVLAAAVLMAWKPPASLAMFLWIGIGGIVSAVAGPLCVGTVWKRATRTAAVTSAMVGSVVYWTVYLPIGFDFSNPFGASAIAILTGMGAMVLISLVTPRPSEKELERIFGRGQDATEEISSATGAFSSAR